MVVVRSVFRFPNPVNDISARGVAAGTAIIGLACLVFGQPWLAVVLVVQFALRVATGPRFEPLALLVTRVITPALPFEAAPDAGATEALRAGDRPRGHEPGSGRVCSWLRRRWATD